MLRLRGLSRLGYGTLGAAVRVVPRSVAPIRAASSSCGPSLSSTIALRGLMQPPTLRRLCIRQRSTLSAPGAGDAFAAAASTTAASAVEAAVPRVVGWWLVGTSVSVFAMVVVGGITRLTRSGLSMTDWRPQGKRWPRNDEEWDVEFKRWQTFPEYQRLYKGTGFAIADFKNIFFWEWFHRMMGRSIGLVYGVPLAYFALRGQIPRSYAPTLGGLLLLGGSQGLVGWWMVKSGLDKKIVDSIDGGIPTVSPYRLAAHLTCAFAIFTTLLYTGLGILQPRTESAVEALRPVRRATLRLPPLLASAPRLLPPAPRLLPPAPRLLPPAPWLLPPAPRLLSP